MQCVCVHSTGALWHVLYNKKIKTRICGAISAFACSFGLHLLPVLICADDGHIVRFFHFLQWFYLQGRLGGGWRSFYCCFKRKQRASLGSTMCNTLTVHADWRLFSSSKQNKSTWQGCHPFEILVWRMSHAAALTEDDTRGKIHIFEGVCFRQKQNHNSVITVFASNTFDDQDKGI